MSVKTNETASMVKYRLTEQVSTNLLILFKLDGSRVKCFLKKLESALNEGTFPILALTCISLLTLDQFRKSSSTVKSFQFGNDDLTDIGNLKGVTEAGLFDGYALPFNFTSDVFEIRISNADANNSLKRVSDELTNLFNADITCEAVLSSNILFQAWRLFEYECLPDIMKIRLNREGHDFQFTLRTFIVGSSTDDKCFKFILRAFANDISSTDLSIGKLDHISDFLIDHLMKHTKVSKVCRFDLISVGFREYVSQSAKQS